MGGYLDKAAVWFAALATTAAVSCTPTTLAPTVSDAEEAAEAREQQKLVIERRVRDAARVYEAGFPLLRDAIAFCGTRIGPRHGFMVIAAAEFDSDQRNLAKQAFALGDLPKVVAVADGSPAHHAGLREGDVIALVNGAPLTADGATGDLFSEPETTQDKLGKLLEKTAFEPVSFTVIRQSDPGQEVNITSTATKACDYNFRVETKDSVNAYANGRDIVLTTGMLRFIESDSELATVMSHELAHNAMGHIDAKMANAAIGSGVGLVLDVLAAMGGVNTQGGFTKLGSNIGGGAFSQSFESEADYVGLYIMARANQDYGNAAQFWRRMATVNPEAIEHASTHPTTAERFVTLKKAIAEIDVKKEAGVALEPETRSVDDVKNDTVASYADR